MNKEKQIKQKEFAGLSRELKLVSFFDEANIFAGIMKKQETARPFNLINSIGYFVLPTYFTTYYCTHENVITRVAENIAICGGAAALLATVYFGWNALIEEGQRQIEIKYDKCFKRGVYPYPPSNVEGRAEYEEYCMFKYGRIRRSD